ncbi:hypothetical protein scyTo_0015790 [Scyliorhinus torazame]|uniref:SHSP domain-containing protein n=1 Tax=Scyliorhinus torazame TaxID=75743 RepID=A0A401PYL6_SCYTO|nr:hypothetical protein [Scyliorhinus torazame]
MAGKIMPNKKQKGHASFAHSPNKYTVAVNLQDAEGPHRVNATVRDTRVNVYGQHVDEIKTKDGEVRYNFHGFSNEFELPENVDPDSLTLSMADNQTILIQGNKRDRRGSQHRQSSPEQKTRSQTKPPTLAQPSENTDEPTPWKAVKDEEVQVPKKNQSTTMGSSPGEPDANWAKLKYTSPSRAPCCTLCCGPV